jgi:hypothetical protein
MQNVALLTPCCVRNLGTWLVVTDGDLRVPVCQALSSEAYDCSHFFLRGVFSSHPHSRSPGGPGFSTRVYCLPPCLKSPSCLLWFLIRRLAGLGSLAVNSSNPRHSATPNAVLPPHKDGVRWKSCRFCRCVR